MATTEEKYSNLKLMFVLAIVMFVALIGAIGFQDHRDRNRQAEMVKLICDQTRTTHDSEVTCGIAQDYTNSEYLCKVANSRTDNTCWVEVK